MIGKLIVGAYKWYIKRLQKKMENAQLTEQQKKQEEFKQMIKQLYTFVQWLNRQFRNKHERKSFWRNVASGQPAIETTMQNLLKAYAPDEEEGKEEDTEAPDFDGTNDYVPDEDIASINPMAQPADE